MELKNISTANTQFGLDLFKIVRQEKKNENVFLSPFSISVALAMTHLGARERTAEQMSSVLGWNNVHEDVIHGEFQKYVSLLQKASDQYQLSTANRLYIEKTMTVLDIFMTKTKGYYNAEPVLADFKTNHDNERTQINNWVSETTHGKINDLLADGVLDPMTRMVLVNAIYFKGLWETQFSADDTSMRNFKVAPSKTKSVSMMNADKRFATHHFSDLQCTTVELPYKGNELSMVIILPDQDFGLEELLSKLTSENLSKLLDSKDWHKGKVDLSLPKFKVSSSFSLSQALKTLGMKDAFSEDANFAGIRAEKDLNVSAVVHKSFVQVDELGTEAAAATAVMIGLMCMPMPSPKVTVDHPFLFVIKDNRPGDLPLFIGAITDPSQI